MGKLKTRKSLVRRIKITGTGKVMRRKGFNRHLKAGKSKARTRILNRPTQITGAFERKIKKVLGLA